MDISRHLSVFADMPPTSRVWIYQSSKNFTPEEEALLASSGEQFASQWLSHGREVNGKIAILFHRFLIIAARQEAFQVSGCSIDKTVQFVRDAGQQFGTDFFDRFYTCVLDGETIEGYTRKAFGEAITSGSITGETPVFNNLVEKLEDLSSKWLVPVSGSWHARVFGA